MLLNKLIYDLNLVFAFKDFRELHDFLGVEIFKDFIEFYLTQSKYIVDLLTKLQMQNYKPSTTLVSTSAKLTCIIGWSL